MTSAHDLCDSNEAAVVLGVSVRTVHRMAKAGKLTPVLRGKGLRGGLFFNRSEVLQHVPAVKAA